MGRDIFKKSFNTISKGKSGEHVHLVFIETRRGDDLWYQDKRKNFLLDLYETLAQRIAYQTGNKMSAHVISMKANDLNALSAKEAFKLTDKEVSKLTDGEPASVVLCSDVHANLVSPGAPYLGLNTILHTKDTKHPYAFKLPLKKTRHTYVLSLPAYIWARTNQNAKETAPNSLGFIYRAGLVAIAGKPEFTIARDMYKYHSRKKPFVFVDTMAKFKKLVKKMDHAKVLTFDTEGDSLQRIDNTIFSLQINMASGMDDEDYEVWFLPLEHPDTPWDSKQFKIVLKRMKKYFEFSEAIHCYKNAKFDLHQVISLFKLDFYAGTVYDVEAGEFSLEENAKFIRNTLPYYGLEPIEARYGYIRPPELVIHKSDRGNMRSFSLMEIAEYGSIDVVSPFHLMREQIRVGEERGYGDFCNFITRQMGPMLIAMTVMEHNGIPIDKDYLLDLASPQGAMAVDIRAAADKLGATKAGRKVDRLLAEQENYSENGLFGKVAVPKLFSIRTAKHLQLLFFEVLGLEPTQKYDPENPPENFSVDAKFQKKHRHTKEIKLFTEYQKLMKLKSSFADAILKFLQKNPDMRDGRLRPIFGFLKVVSGRSSTEKPSSQQLPKHGPRAKIIKKQFAVVKGRLVGTTDFSAHEVRVSGNLSSDPAILKAVNGVNAALYEYRVASPKKAAKLQLTIGKRTDIHIANAKEFFDKEIEKDDPLRQGSKAAVFAITYGSSSKSIGKTQLNDKLVDAEDLVLKLSTELKQLEAA